MNMWASIFRFRILKRSPNLAWYLGHTQNSSLCHIFALSYTFQGTGKTVMCFIHNFYSSVQHSLSCESQKSRRINDNSLWVLKLYPKSQQLLPYIPFQAQSSTLIFLCSIYLVLTINIPLFVRICLIISRYKETENIGFRLQLHSICIRTDWP